MITVFTVALFASVFKAQAAGDLSRQVPLEVRVQLGDDKGVRRSFPERIELGTGKLYRLILSNPSPEKHYFSSDAFAQAIYTRKVQVNGLDGNAVAEIKGSVREIEVDPRERRRGGSFRSRPGSSAISSEPSKVTPRPAWLARS